MKTGAKTFMELWHYCELALWANVVNNGLNHHSKYLALWCAVFFATLIEYACSIRRRQQAEDSNEYDRTHTAPSAIPFYRRREYDEDRV